MGQLALGARRDGVVGEFVGDAKPAGQLELVATRNGVVGVLAGEAPSDEPPGERGLGNAPTQKTIYLE